MKICRRLKPATDKLNKRLIGTTEVKIMHLTHLQAYLNEMCFRFDNCMNPFLFRDTLLRLLQSEHLEYKELVSAA